MKSANKIIQENIDTNIPNAGIKALAKAAYDDPDGFCILDDDSCFSLSYREECLDRCSCHRADYMLVCVATRNPYANEIGNKAVKIYNKAIGNI